MAFLLNLQVCGRILWCIIRVEKSVMNSSTFGKSKSQNMGKRSSRRRRRIPWKTILRVLAYIIVVLFLFKYGERMLNGFLDFLHL